MKQNIFWCLMMSVMYYPSFSQSCAEASLIQKPGAWKEGMKGAVSGIQPSDLAREQAIVGTLHTMLRSKYVPMGVSADYHGAYGYPQSTMPGNTYSYNIIPLNYYCDGNSIKTAHETSSYFSITVNYFETEIYEAPQGDRALAEGFNVMNDMPVEKDGYYYFKEKDVTLGFGMSGKRSMWLITHNGKLPYAYVTKKEFLEKRKQILEVEMTNSSSGFKDVLKNIEIEKRYKEAELKNDGEKLSRYMKMDYNATKERYEKLLAENEKNYKAALIKVENLLKMSADDLRQPAIVKQDPNDHLSYLFTNDDDPFGKILIKPNPGYFNKKLPRSSPQFFCVYITGNHQDTIAAKAMADIMKAVDFTLLKNLVGK